MLIDLMLAVYRDALSSTIFSTHETEGHEHRTVLESHSRHFGIALLAIEMPQSLSTPVRYASGHVLERLTDDLMH